jgi:UDP-4-amino-4,6-dideoxy-L-N-acetyl-beta-L-altrosamine transaminase
MMHPFGSEVVPFIKNNFIFQLRESSCDLTIVKGSISIDMGPFTIVKSRGFDALKYEVIFDKWYNLCIGKIHSRGLRSRLKRSVVNGFLYNTVFVYCSREKMETTNFIPYAHQSIDGTDIDAVSAALKQHEITRGAQVAAFEQEICDRVHALHGVAFSSGSTALYAAFQAANVEPQDRIVTSPNTFVATVAGAVRSGARLRFVDIDEYGNIDLSLLGQELSPRQSRGKTIVIPIHFAGVAVDMKRLDELIFDPQAIVIEDAAHALGSLYPDGSPVGCCAYSDMTVFSFHAIKNITCGEGGMVMTNDHELYHRLRKIRDSGIEHASLVGRSSTEPWYYEISQLSCNFHMTEMQAALGRSQLKRLDSFFQKKASLIAAYRRKLASTPGVFLHPSEPDFRTHYHLFQIDVEFESLGLTRTKVMEGLQALSIGSQYHYVPLYCHPALTHAISQSSNEFPVMEEHFKKSLSIPFFSGMAEDDVDRVVTSLRKVLFQL